MTSHCFRWRHHQAPTPSMAKRGRSGNWLRPPTTKRSSRLYCMPTTTHLRESLIEVDHQKKRLLHSFTLIDAMLDYIRDMYAICRERNKKSWTWCRSATAAWGRLIYLVSDFITPVSPSKTRIQRKRTRRCTDCTHARFVTYITCDDYKKRWVNWVRLAENACVYRR